MPPIFHLEYPEVAEEGEAYLISNSLSSASSVSSVVK